MKTSLEKEFERIYASHYGKMRNYAHHLCGSREDAEDITQDAFMRAYRALPNCDNLDKLDKWLTRIVFRTFVDFTRAQKRKPLVWNIESPLAEELADDGCTNPEQQTMQNSIDGRIMRAIQRLDQTSREMMVHAYVQDWSTSDIGQKFHLDTQAVRARLIRSCGRIRRELNPTNRQNWSMSVMPNTNWTANSSSWNFN